MEADRESDSSLSDSFLDVPQDFSLEYVLSHTEKKNNNIIMQLSKSEQKNKNQIPE